MDHYHTSLYIVGIMEKYDHIQTGMEKIFGLYDVVFSGIYDSIQIRYGVGLYGVVLHRVGLYGGGGVTPQHVSERNCSLHGPLVLKILFCRHTLCLSLSLSLSLCFSTPL